MAAARASNVIQLFNRDEVYDSSPGTAQPYVSDLKGKTVDPKVEDSTTLQKHRLLLSVAESLKEDPDKIIKALSIIFESVNLSEKKPLHDEYEYLEIESANAIEDDQHKENINKLTALKAIVPDTSKDIPLKAE